MEPIRMLVAPHIAPGMYPNQKRALAYIECMEAGTERNRGRAQHPGVGETTWGLVWAQAA